MSPRKAGTRAQSCPICGRPAQPDVRPFCSTRCADVDLGRWLGERYAIPETTPDTAHEPRDYSGAQDDTPGKA